jgi:hypothetical protein
MDPIFVNNSSIQSHHKPGAKSELSGTKTKDSAPNQAILPRADLTDIPSLANTSMNSGPDLRPDVLARAEKLLNDPDWLNDSNLDALAQRLMIQEDL